MRVVENPEASAPGGASAPEGLLPTAEQLERGRTLAARFPDASLRETTFVRLPSGPRGLPALGIPDPVRVWLALESMQVSGSFKVRGALLALEATLVAWRRDPRSAPRRREVVAASAGNHGIGVALAARTLGVSATVVVPSGAPQAKTDKIAAYGATVVRSESAGYDGAEAEAIALARSRGVPFISPYDDVDVIVGNGGSLAFEIVRALGRVPEVVLAPIGGGGLATGLACALALEVTRTSSSVRPEVWGVQSEASPAFAMSLERGAAVAELPPTETLAEGLEGGIPERAFARARAVLAGALVTTEEEIARAMKHAYRELGLVLEGSAAAALTPVLAPAPHLGPGGERAAQDAFATMDAPRTPRDVVCVVTGRNVDPERLTRVVC